MRSVPIYNILGTIWNIVLLYSFWKCFSVFLGNIWYFLHKNVKAWFSLKLCCFLFLYIFDLLNIRRYFLKWSFLYQNFCKIIFSFYLLLKKVISSWQLKKLYELSKKGTLLETSAWKSLVNNFYEFYKCPKHIWKYFFFLWFRVK